METNPPPTVLCCDHRGAGLQALVGGLAGHPWRVETSTSVVASMERAPRLQPDVLVLDPLIEGGRVELETILIGVAAEARPAILILFDPARPEAALATATTLAVEHYDVLQRGARPEELRLRIERLVAARERERELAELRHRALHDDGTGLLRPSAFQARLAEHCGAAARHRLDLALVLVDLDRFGAVNKTFDHVVGDRILARVGEAVRAALRVEDVAGRIGGDEFAILLPYTKKVEAAHVTRRLLEQIRGVSGRFAGAESAIEVTASLGFETFDGVDLDGPDTLRSHAEVALRAAKRAGGNRVVYFRSLKR